MCIPHDLHYEFPRESAYVDHLTKTSYRFKRLAARYDQVNLNIYRIETEEQPTTDDVLERLKKLRLDLKDKIAADLTKLKRRM